MGCEGGDGCSIEQDLGLRCLIHLDPLRRTNGRLTSGF
jgi:hypothetical protein